MTNNKLTHLKWWDILVLTLILFGQAIYTSTAVFMAGQAEAVDATAVTDGQNYYMLVVQALTLLIALAYLWWRRFDFSQWQFKVTGRATLLALGLFLTNALLMDGFYLLLSPEYREYYANTPLDLSGLPAALGSPLVLSTIFYALLNGIYEELYFIGICLATTKEQRLWVWLFSVLVRFSFHTYQGILPALGIGVILGSVYYLWYDRLGKRNFYPIFLSHAIADVFGLTVLFYLF